MTLTLPSSDEVVSLPYNESNQTIYNQVHKTLQSA